MTTVAIDTNAGRIEGHCDERFDAVLAAFIENFERRAEVGASVAINLEGENVVDLWGGKKTPEGDAWQSDTICTVFSATKGAAALCLHLLADRGEIDLDALVTDYWPEFGAGDKDSARVSMMLDHSVGVPHVRGAVPEGGFYDYDTMVKRVAAEPAFWEPGTRGGYHGITMAWTVGELVHRVSGMRLGQFFNDEVAQPLGLDFWIGLPAEFEDRVAPMIASVPDDPWMATRFIQTALGTKDTPTYYFMRDFMLIDVNTRECHAAEIGSANGIANGRSLAALYAPLANGGALEGQRLLSADTLARMGRVSMASHDDATLCIPTRFALGYMKTVDNRRVEDSVNSSLLMAEPAFGHVGAGGSLGFADPDVNMSFGYAMNRMGTGLLLNDRGQSLVDAAYQSLGFRSNKSGAWIS